MDKIIALFCESAEYAFFLGTFLYAMAFAGDLLVSKWSHSGGAVRQDRIAS